MNEYELAEFFREELHMKTDVVVTKYILFADNQKVIVDIVLKNEEHEIVIEHKGSGDIVEIERGIGQALINLLIYKESWLSVPEHALKLAIPILERINVEAFRILDWENMQLYELKNGKAVATGL
jgi:hypothetical protein